MIHFFEGIGAGLLLALVFGFGPAFFLIIQTAINHGFKSAMHIAIGISLNDILIVVLCLMSSIKFDFEDPQKTLYAGIAACIVLVIFGIYTIFHKSKAVIKKASEAQDPLSDIEINSKRPKSLVLMGKGFIMNIFNPFVWIYWLALVASVAGRLEPMIDRIMFFVGVLATCLCFDILKSLGASALKRFFTPKMISIMNVIIGILLIISGFFILGKILFF